MRALLAVASGSSHRAMASAAAAATQVGPSLLDGELALIRARLRTADDPATELAELQAAAAEAERSGRTSLVARAWLAVAGALFDRAGDEATFDNAMRQAEWAIDRLRTRKQFAAMLRAGHAPAAIKRALGADIDEDGFE